MKIEMFVGLKIPDNIAITAKLALKRMNYHVENIKRYDYYDIEADESVKEKLAKTDILVNANKNTCSFELKKEGFQVIVKDLDQGDGLKNTLSHVGVEVQKAQKGYLWTLFVDSKEEALEIVKKLLYNENYQEIEVIE